MYKLTLQVLALTNILFLSTIPVFKFLGFVKLSKKIFEQAKINTEYIERQVRGE